MIVNETKINPHFNSKLRQSYEDVYRIMRSIKSDDHNIDCDFYFSLINSNPNYPTWLKRQMIKLIKRRIDRILDKTIKRKWFEFRLIVPRCKAAWVEGLIVPEEYFIKHLYYDSRCTFLTIHKIVKNGKVKFYNPKQLAAYAIGTEL